MHVGDASTQHQQSAAQSKDQTLSYSSVKHSSISDLLVDNCDLSGELLAFVDSRAIAALSTALRFNKRACHVLEDERRWLELLRLQCGVVKAKDGDDHKGGGYVRLKIDRADENEQRTRVPTVVTPTVRAFGCCALVDFLSLRSQIQHLTQDVHVVDGDAKTIARVGGRDVDFRPSDLECFYPFTAPYLDVYRTHCHEYARALRAIVGSSDMKCAAFAPLADSVPELLPQVEARIALLLVRDAILARDFGASIAFVCSSESVLRAFRAARDEVVDDVLGRDASASRPELAASDADNVVSSLVFYDWWLATRSA